MTATERHVGPALAAALLAAALAAGCAGTPEDRAGDSRTLERIESALEQGSQSNAGKEPPPDVQDALMPELEAALPAGPSGEAAEAERFDLAVSKASAQSFFRGLVEGTHFNMVVHPDVTGTISLELKDVTVPEVMQIVRRVYGFEYERRGNGYIVMPARLQSRIFHVDYLTVSRKGESNTHVSSGQVTGANGDDDDDSNDDDAGRSRARQQIATSRIKTQSRADFWGNLRQTLRTLIGGGEGRSVIVEPQAGLVVVRGMPGELRDVAEYLQAAQGNLQRQVILEAKILEVQLTEGHQAGINWAALADDDGSGDQVSASQGEIVDEQASGIQQNRPSLLDTRSAVGSLDFGGVFAVGAMTEDFQALIRLLDTQGDVRVLSSPRVSTLNNQKAVIKVGTDEFFVTDVDTEEDVGTVTATQSVDVELTPFFSGIALDVTPQVSRDGSVTMHVHPTVSDVEDQQKTIQLLDQTQQLPLARSSVRETDSIVRARDGQVIVIGGLMEDRDIRRAAKSGGLGDLPVVGRLFRQNADQSERSELVILLKPVVADSGTDWSREMDAVRERLRRQGDQSADDGEGGG